MYVRASGGDVAAFPSPMVKRLKTENALLDAR